MKRKMIIFFLALILIFVSYQFYKWTIKEFHVSYIINNYKIEEYYHKEVLDTYDFVITKKGKNYTFTIQENLKKKKRIISSIKTYKEKEIECILVTDKNKNNTLHCRINKEQVSLNYLIQTGNEDFKAIQEKIKKVSIDYPSVSETKKEYHNLIVYNKNILENQIFYLWNYKGVYILGQKENRYAKVLDYDLYDNLLSCTVNDKYVLLENTSVNGIKNIYYYDYKKGKWRIAKLKQPISKDSYINGVKDNLIYITDRKLKKQYTLDIQKEKLTEIDEEETKYISYKNNKKIELSKSDFFLKDQFFKDHLSDERIEGDYTYSKIGNRIYRKYKNNTPVLLLELDSIKEWQIIGDEILMLKEETLYSYNDHNGLRKIVEYNELQYNDTGIYKLGEK